MIQKSIWQRGFQNIREFARDKQLTRRQNKGLSTVKKLFWQRNCAAAFSKWRQTEYELTLEHIEMTHDAILKVQEEHVEERRII